MSGLLRRTRLKPVSGRKRKRSGQAGKLGIVRLSGLALRELRIRCWLRDGGCCCECKRAVTIDGHYPWDGVMHMAHIRTKRNNGDTIDNVRTLCPECHGKEHNAGGKPCPAKPIKEEAA